MSFLNEMKLENNKTETFNGELGYKYTLSSLLDLSTYIGNTRFTDVDDFLDLLVKSFNEDELITSKLVAYARDIRQGGGDKTFGRVGFARMLVEIEEDKVEKLVDIIAEYGSYKDVVGLLNPSLYNANRDNIVKLVEVLDRKLQEDLISNNPSLLAKYMPTESSNNKTVKNAYKIFMTYSDITPKGYRKRNTSIRKKLDIVETKLTEKDYNSIEYSKVPSQAGMKYRESFWRNDGERYEKYLEDVNNGDEKINTGTLAPYQIVDKAEYGGYDKSIVAMWDNLKRPDNKGLNVLPVVDVSASMYGLPMTVAVSLGLILAESIEGEFKDHFITFSENPELEKVRGKDIYEKVRNMEDSDWGFNTNLEKVFNLVLNTAKNMNAEQKDMPECIIIFSDMQMDRAIGEVGSTFYEKMRNKYEENGYKLPFIVFWDIGYGDAKPVVEDTENTMLVSGFSQNIFDTIFNIDLDELQNYTPMKALLETLESDRYKLIEDLYK